MFRCGVGPACAPGQHAGDGGDRCDVGWRAGLEQWEQREHCPDVPQIVRAKDLFDAFGLEVEEPAATGYPGVVDEQVKRVVALGDAGGHRVDLIALCNVAYLDLTACLACELLEPVPPAGREDALPALGRELARDCGSEAARRAGNERYALAGRLLHPVDRRRLSRLPGGMVSLKRTSATSSG